MKKQELDILNVLHMEPFINQRVLAEKSGHSLGIVNRSVKNLIENGFLDDRNQLTTKALDEFEAGKPKNAIILAAGFGLRMVPINMNTPKALMEIKGERLIDRLITQLHEVGISDITVVVGFMKDSFEYLIDEYGVKLIYNDAYAAKNNLHSLALAAESIGNSYIVPCDVWCDRNPFRLYELYSWYMVSDLVDEASEVRVNRKTELVKLRNGIAGNGMIGISYITGNDTQIVKERILEMTKNAAYDDKFWEEALYTGDRMIVPAQIVHASDVVEINTYEQLRALDSDSNQLKSDALKFISEQFGCKTDEITNIEILKKGMTNRSFLFSVRGCRYIMRIPGEGTDKLINRIQEAENYRAIAGLRICDSPVCIDSERGYKITKYIEGVRCCDPKNEEDLRCCMKKLRTFHAMKLKVPHTFDIYGMIDFYEKLWGGQPSIYKDYKKTKELVLSLRSYIDRHKEPFQLTHIDAVPDNFLFDPAGSEELSVQLIDWEYAGMQDKHVDIAMFCIYSCYDKESIDRLIDIYFEEEGGCSKAVRAKIYCYISATGLLWSNWCEYKRSLGVEFGEYSLYQYRYGKEFYRYAAELMDEIGESSEREYEV